jgi:diguanylate cyclase (GGDEF)-like protein
VTLRARLTAAFLAVVLGPVLLGAIFVGVSVSAIGRVRAVERLAVADGGARAAVSAICQRLRAAAETGALLTEGGSRPHAAGQVVERGLATGVRVTSPEGVTLALAGNSVDDPVADCAASTPPPANVRALVARVAVVDRSGSPIGYAEAGEPVDAAFAGRLAAAAGADVTILGTELSTQDGEVSSTARDLASDATGETSNGRYVRRVDPEPGQPLVIAVSVSAPATSGLYAILVAVVVCAGLVAVSAAWWLARSTTRPLTELAHTVERVASGDLTARVAVRSQDEVGRLGATFNRMTREMQGYVQALTASRDQLRGQLGVLGDTLSSTHDIAKILRVLLQTAMGATGAQAGIVLLAEPTTGVLVGQCGEGLPGPTEVRVRPGEGLLGSVTATGEPRRGRISRDGPGLSTSEPPCRTYVAVPFTAPARGPLDPAGDGSLPAARGVLALYDRHGFDEFDDADLVTLRTFAGQAAVALDNVRVHEEAQRLSLTDPLTGLSNYRYLKESLRREVERASRFGRKLTILALDLDRFKDINDTHGHATGDAVLAEFARRIRDGIREVDFAFRQGGEEFVVLLPETDAVGGAVVAQRLGAAVRRTPVTVDSPDGTSLSVPVTVSIGVAVFPDNGATGPAVLEAADDALYAAKAAGRDTHCLAAAVSRPDADADAAELRLGASGGATAPRQSRGG